MVYRYGIIGIIGIAGLLDDCQLPRFLEHMARFETIFLTALLFLQCKCLQFPFSSFSLTTC